MFSIPHLHKQFLMYFLLGIIVLGGFFVRVYKNTQYPAGFFCDEAGLTYEAYTIANTGKDSLGNTLPFYFTVFSPRGPVAIYDQVLFVWVFGLSEFTSRVTAAFIGTLTIILTFFLTKELLKNRITALYASFLTAISPWHIQFSRFGTENIRLPFYFGLFLLFFLLGKRIHKKTFILLSIIFLFLGFYAYTAADVFILPFIIGIIIIYYKYLIRNKTFLLLLIGLTIICFIPFLYQMLFFSQESRFAQVSVFNNKSTSEAIMQMAKTYLESYSPDFLFLKGDAGMSEHFINRFSVKGFGELYLISLPFFILGLFYLLKYCKKKENQIMLLWLLLYPVGSVVAGADGGGPFATRSIIGVLIFQIITALGITYTLHHIKHIRLNIIVTVSILVLYSISFGFYIYSYFFTYPLYSEDFWGWQYGARDIVHYFVQHQTGYANEVMAPEFNAPDIFFKFYAPNDCNKCKLGLPEDSFDAYHKQLFAVTPLYLQKHPEFVLKIQKKIIYPNGSTAFLIGEIKNLRDNKQTQ